MDYDALVLGGGIAGMESALKLGDMGYHVVLVEKEASVGGKMILLSKVFPTLDCASCISTPKMAASVHHDRVDVLTYSELESVRRTPDGRFRVRVRRKPRFVDEQACTGCQQCEMACTVAVPDQFNADLVSRRAAYIPFPQAVPKKAVIDRAGTSPCTYECPAGIKAHGYVSLVRSGEYEKAFQLVLENTPLVGSLGRACFAPCEDQCSRGRLEGPVPIRRIKRFIADTHYGAGLDVGRRPNSAKSARIAIVGAGPAGLTAAWQLRLKGYAVTVFDQKPVAGGAMALSIPAYRLPGEVVAQDVANVTAIGVEIKTGWRVEDLDALKADGYDAIIVAAGTPTALRLNVPGDGMPGTWSALDFLEQTKLGPRPDVKGRDVVVVGGGNVAIDSARSAIRLGARSVHLVSLETRPIMPAFPWEVEEALAEGVVLHDGWGVRRIVGTTGVEGVELVRCTSVYDDAGRFRPTYDESVTSALTCDVVVQAIGMRPDTEPFAKTVALNPNRTVRVNPDTLQTEVPYIFAAGDVVTGPTTIAKAVGSGQRAAHMLDRWLSGLPFDVEEFDVRLPRVEPETVLARQTAYTPRPPVGSPKHLVPRPTTFEEIEPPLSEEEAIAGTARCLDCGVCSECHECVHACPADAIHLERQPEIVEMEVGALVLATGFKLFPADLKPQYGYGRYANVITGMQMDRLLAPTRPYHSIVRPGDGRVPNRIAYIMCTGSRDRTVGNPLCSKICCMYSIKQNQLIMGSLPLADVTVFYIDMRPAGKGYEEFYVQSQAMGATYVKGRVARITEKPNGNLVLRYENFEHGGQVEEDEFDLVVLAVGVQPTPEAAALFEGGGLALDAYDYIAEVDPDLSPGVTSIPGVFVAGTAAGAKDIPDSILHAGAVVAEAAAYLEQLKAGRESATADTRTKVSV